MVQYTPEWLELEKQQGGRTALSGGPEQMHEQFDALMAALAPTMPAPDPTVSKAEETIDGVRCLVFKPTDAPAGQKLPVGIFTHSGGYVLGNPETEALLCEVVAKNTPAVVVSVDYRKAPKHKHPAALEDSLKVYKAVYENADKYGGDKSRFFAIGGSAGGALALGVTNQLVADPALKSAVKGCVAIVPAALHPENVPAEYKSEYTAYDENATDTPVIDRAAMESFYNAVGADPKDKDNFVGLATENHKNFPPTYFVACEGDPLRDDAVVMEKMLKKAGIKTKLDMYKGLPHYFWIFSSIPEGQQFMGNLLQGVQFVLA